MPQPDWIAIFTTHDRLTPPGYAETFIAMQGLPRPMKPVAPAAAPPPPQVVRSTTAGASASVNGEPGWWSPSGVLRGERTVLVDPRGVTRLVSTKGVTLATNRANRAGGRRPAQFPSLKHGAD
jgi:hypothetical protein